MARRAKQDEGKRPSAQPSGAEDLSYGDMLLYWITQGYDVTDLVKDLQYGAKEESCFEEYGKRIRRANEIVAEVGKLEGIAPERVESLRKMSKSPSKLPEMEKDLADLKFSPRLKELRADFLSLNVKGFEDEARRIQAKFSDNSKLDEIEHDIKILRRRIKERFFANEFAVQLEPADASGNIVAETVFIIHKDGTLLAVKSKQSKDSVDKKALSRMVLEIRARMETGSTGSFQAEGSNIVLERGNHVCVAVSFKGEEQSIMRRVIDKVIQIMERKNADIFGSWTGERARVTDVDRYPTAVFQALDALEKKA
jgi:hypothetical protein